MIARVKWCKPVSSCTRLRPNGKCFESRREGNLSRSEIHCCRNVVRWEYAIVTVAVYPLDKGGEQERVPVRITFGSETSRNTKCDSSLMSCGCFVFGPLVRREQEFSYSGSPRSH